MTTKTTHTPAPWKSRDAVVLHGIEKSQDCAILDGENCIIGECFEKVGRTSEGRFLYRPSKANAAHIVRCVNEREELIEVLRYAAALNWEVENKIHAILARAQQEG